MEDLYRLLKPESIVPEPSFPGKIAEVILGSTPEEGGSSRHSLSIGGGNALPFFSSKSKKPILASIVYDSPKLLPAVVRKELGGSAEDPIEWAKLSLNSGAEAIALKLQMLSKGGIGLKLYVKNLIRRLLDEVRLPLIITLGASEASTSILNVAAETAKCERCILAPITLEGEYRSIAETAVKYGHSVVAETDCDPSSQRSLNQKLLDVGLDKTQLLMDPTSAALGLGIEYSISIIEQIKLDALKGDEVLQVPVAILRALEYSWKAREAWDPSISQNPEFMGPLWEAHTALTLYLAGADLLAILHPKALKIVKSLLSNLTKGDKR